MEGVEGFLLVDADVCCSRRHTNEDGCRVYLSSMLWPGWLLLSAPKQRIGFQRLHGHRQGGTPVRIKIVRGDGKAPLNVYRAVSEAGKTGWQPMRPAGFRAVPYFHQDANPFDGEGKIYWTGDEETADDRRWPRQCCTGNSPARCFVCGSFQS